GHPEEAVRALVDQAQLAPEPQPQRAEHPRGQRPLARDEEEGRRRLASQRRELLRREELRDRRAHLALLVVDEVGEPRRAELARRVLEGSELAARELLRHAQEADGR